MARRLRLEYPGALYHVINRGNYRSDVFTAEGAAQAFEAALVEACDRYRWRLHAHVVMRNHYHAAIETPNPTLVAGMHWLQGTFAARFNRFRSERGHLFQGRYQAILIEDEAALARVGDYIHLNPVRAGLVGPDGLERYPWSSVRWLNGTLPPSCFDHEALLRAHGLLDLSDGRARYLAALRQLATDEAQQKQLGFEGFNRGTAIGTAAWLKAIAEEFRACALDPALSSAEAGDLREHLWKGLLEQLFVESQRTQEQAAAEPRSASWKIDVARRLRHAGVPYRWIAHQLHMGCANSVRSYVNTKAG